MLMMLHAAGVVCFILGIGGLSCCHLAVLFVMLILLRLSWLISRDTWLRLSTSLMVLASRSRLLVGPIWVHLSALWTLSQTICRIAHLSGFRIYIICHHLLLLNPMLHLQFLCMAFCPNWTTTSGLLQTSMICCLLYSLLFVKSFCPP